MSQLQRYWNEKYRVYAAPGYSPAQIEAVIALVQNPSVLEEHLQTSQVPALTGRSMLFGGTIPGIGDVVLKTYKRGGFLRYFQGHSHMRFGQSRSRKEFKMLEQVRQHGVRAPEPVFYIEQGEFWYRAWLVTRRIPNAQTLIDIAFTDEARAIALAKAAAQQIGLLIKQGIHHVDLHPGNVVVGADDLVYIVDFDKACDYSGRLNDLRDTYLRRWRRAVIKHKLPELLSEAVSLELRDNYE